ncbi:MAG TPA: hypothetical protein VFR15_07080, partial [Chloroflexia bacterium]|nr:hypothetical protein [Chloroflexia bacterium]
SAAWLDFPYPRVGSEGLILYETLLVKRGGDLYPPITPERFISGPYPPVYYYLAAPLLPDTLPDFSRAGAVDSIFAGGRTVSLVAAIVAAVMVALLVVLQGGYGRLGRRGRAVAVAGGALGGLLLLSLPQVTVWATRFRGDMLMVALTAAGLVCVAAGAREQGEHPRWWLLWAGAALFALALFTKHTALAGPGAAAAYLLLRDVRVGLKWAAGMAGLVLVPFAALDIATGHWFYLKMVDYHALPLRALTLSRLLEQAFWEDQWPLIVASVGYVGLTAYLAWRGRRRGEWRRAPLLIALYTMAAIVTLPTGAVVGADHNHLLLAGLAVASGTGALVAWLLDRVLSRGGALVAVGGVAVAGLVLAHVLWTSEPSRWYDPDLAVPGQAQQEQLRQIVDNARRYPGTLAFSDDPGFVALAAKQTDYDDPFTMTALALSGRWDEAAFRDRLRSGDFALLVLSCDVNRPDTCRSDTFTPGVLDAIRDGYDILYRDVLFTYVPKN